MSGHPFTSFFSKFPIEDGESYIVKMIHKALDCAEKEAKENPEGDEHVKYVVKAYHMIDAYLTEKGINPSHYDF